MTKAELEEKIKEIEYFISDQKIKRSGHITFVIMTIATIMGSGLVLGLLFGSLNKILMLAVAIAALINATTTVKIEELSRSIKNESARLATFKDDLEEMKERSNTKTVVKVRKREVKEEKKDYSYNKEKNESKPEVKIERFTEEDFGEDNSEHKTR